MAIYEFGSQDVGRALVAERASERAGSSGVALREPFVGMDQLKHLVDDVAYFVRWVSWIKMASSRGGFFVH